MNNLIFLSSQNNPDQSSFFLDMLQAIKDFFSPKNISDIALAIIISIVLVIVAHYLIKLINYLIKKSLSKAKKMTKRMEKKGKKPRGAINYSLIYFIQGIVRALIYTIVLFIILALFKVNFTSFGTILAGAVAGISLSLQDVISSLAYGVIILSENAYKIDDYIVLGDGNEGTVKSINLLATILVTVDGQTIFIPNYIVGKEAIYNTCIEPVRRVDIDFNMPSSTNLGKVRDSCCLEFSKDERVFKDPKPYMVVLGFNEESVSLSLRAYCTNGDYWDLLFKLSEVTFVTLQKIDQRFGKTDIKVSFDDNGFFKESLTKDLKVKKGK